MSSDYSDGRISLSALQELRETVDVGSLNRAADYPFDFDSALESAFDERVGALGLVLTFGADVLFGWGAVASELSDKRDSGLVEIVDLKSHGWGREKAKAAAIGLYRRGKALNPDEELLASWMVEALQFDETLEELVGADLETIEAIVSELSSESDELTDDLKIGGGGNLGTDFEYQVVVVVDSEESQQALMNDLEAMGYQGRPVVI